MDLKLKKNGKFSYVEEGQGQPIILLHGLFGSLSNYDSIIQTFSKTHRVLVPVLPILELPRKELSVKALAIHVYEFIHFLELGSAHILGNSLGGHVGLVLTLAKPEVVSSLILTGSSGLFEQGLGKSFPRRQSYDYVRTASEAVFFNPNVATKDLVDNVFSVINDAEKALNIVVAAKSAMKHNLEDELHKINTPTLLIWGRQDSITPPFVAEAFHLGIENSSLHFIDECGHAPMMEKPVIFNSILAQFLRA